MLDTAELLPSARARPGVSSTDGTVTVTATARSPIQEIITTRGTQSQVKASDPAIRLGPPPASLQRLPPVHTTLWAETCAHRTPPTPVSHPSQVMGLRAPPYPLPNPAPDRPPMLQLSMRCRADRIAPRPDRGLQDPSGRRRGPTNWRRTPHGDALEQVPVRACPTTASGRPRVLIATAQHPAIYLLPARGPPMPDA